MVQHALRNLNPCGIVKQVIAVAPPAVEAELHGTDFPLLAATLDHEGR